MSQNIIAMNQVPTDPFPTNKVLLSNPEAFQMFNEVKKLNGFSTIDFQITAKCSQVYPYCWRPRCFRNPVDTDTAKCIIAHVKELGPRRIVFTGDNPPQCLDSPEMIRYAQEISLETALSTTGVRITQAIRKTLSPYLDLISLPLDGSTDEVNSRTKHAGHFAAVLRALDWLRF